MPPTLSHHADRNAVRLLEEPAAGGGLTACALPYARRSRGRRVQHSSARTVQAQCRHPPQSVRNQHRQTLSARSEALLPRARHPRALTLALALESSSSVGIQNPA